MLLEVKHLQVDEALQAQKNAVTLAASQCQDTISQFLAKIAKFQPVLRAGETVGRAGGARMPYERCSERSVRRRMWSDLGRRLERTRTRF